jgi:hypothetical protein
LLTKENLPYIGLAVGIAGVITQPVVIDRIKGWFGKNKQQEDDNLIERSVLLRQAKTLSRMGIDDYYLDPHTKRFDFDLENSGVTLQRIKGSMGNGFHPNARLITPLSIKGASSRKMLRNLGKYRTTISTRNASNQFPHLFKN